MNAPEFIPTKTDDCAKPSATERTVVESATADPSKCISANAVTDAEPQHACDEPRAYDAELPIAANDNVEHVVKSESATPPVRRAMTRTERIAARDEKIREQKQRNREDVARGREKIAEMEKRNREAAVKQRRQERKMRSKQESIAKYHLADAFVAQLAAIPEHEWPPEFRDVLRELSELDYSVVEQMVERRRSARAAA